MDFSNGQLNVFSPAGLALPGAKRGERIRFMSPGGDEKVSKVLQILFQPEAADEFTLRQVSGGEVPDRQDGLQCPPRQVYCVRC